MKLIIALILAIGLADVASGQTVANVLAQVNAQRARRGLYPFQPAADLQAAAMRRASYHAHLRRGGHFGEAPRPGRAEGTGINGFRDPYGQRFISCLHSPGDYTRRHRYAGAAAAVSPSGRTYYCLVVR